MSALNSSPSIESMQQVDLKESADLEEQDACIALAEFIATAISLDEFYISRYTGRDILIEVNCANEG